MKTIKQRILISFCIAVAMTIAVVGGTVSWKMNSSVSQQSAALADYVAERTYGVADSYNEMLRSLIADIQKEMYRTTKDLTSDPALAKNIESQQLGPLASRLQGAAESSGASFVAVFDLKGRLQAASPKGADAKTLEALFQSWELGVRVRERLKGKAQNDEGDLVSVTKHDAQLLKELGLENLTGSAQGGISVAAAGIIRDDFQEAMGICITGKLLNGHNGPLKQLYEATGAASLIYLNGSPIAHAGILGKDEKGGEQALLLDGKARETVLKAPKRVHLPLALAGRSYVASCSPLMATGGEKVALLCSALPGQQIVEAQQMMYTYGNQTKQSIQVWILLIGALAMLAFVAVALVIAKGIIRPISQAIQGLMEGSNQVSAAADQISVASQSLAEEASEQASSLEETSSSLEEMASMTRQNADNAKLADDLMKKAAGESRQAKDSMSELIVSMGEITRASEETSKIVKTIDEIAFQTNLLALNAAVEAARAGEAGAGFAVVADEVRRLALRATEAAKNTSGLIETTVKRVQQGADHVNRTNEAFSQVADDTLRGGALVAEISAASNEQAQGIAQINRAVAEMDKVVQQTAANAEESASASEEMNAQAEQMRGYVDDLALLVGRMGSGGPGQGEPGRVDVAGRFFPRLSGEKPARAREAEPVDAEIRG